MSQSPLTEESNTQSTDSWTDRAGYHRNISKSTQHVEKCRTDLSQPQANEQLRQWIQTDEQFVQQIHETDPQGLAYTCALGNVLAHVITDKSSKLNIQYQTECLHKLAQALKTQFSETQTSGVNFVNVSKSGMGAFLKLANLQAPFTPWPSENATLDKSNKKTRKVTKESVSPSPLKELISESTINLQESDTQDTTVYKTHQLYNTIQALTNQGQWINFWRLVVDPRGKEGYNRTCYTLFLITRLTQQNVIQFAHGKSTSHAFPNILLIRATPTSTSKKSDAEISFYTSSKRNETEVDSNVETLFLQNGKPEEHHQAVITGWNYKVWVEFCEALNLSDKDKPLFDYNAS